MLKLVASSLIGLAAAAPAADKVTQMPGFDATSFGVVSRIDPSPAPVLLKRAPLRLLRSGCPPPPPPHCACPRLATRPLPPARRRRPASCLVPRPLRFLSAASSSAPLLLDQLFFRAAVLRLPEGGRPLHDERVRLALHPLPVPRVPGRPEDRPHRHRARSSFRLRLPLPLTRPASSSGTRAGRAAPRST